jgi:hypothetical protein
MWDTTNLNPFSNLRKNHVEGCGIPRLAKNERDMGHPTILGRDKKKTPPFLEGRRPDGPLVAA